MAKQKTTKSNTAKKQTSGNTYFSDFLAYIKKHKIVSVFILIAVVGIGIYSGLILYEKQQFNKAEKALDSLYVDIVAELGEPVSYEKDKSCSRSSAKYSSGRLSCSIEYRLSYGEGDLTALANKFYSAAQKSSLVDEISEPYRYQDVGSYTIKMVLGGVPIGCGATIGNNADSTFVIFSCGNKTHTSIYPMES